MDKDYPSHHEQRAIAQDVEKNPSLVSGERDKMDEDVFSPTEQTASAKGVKQRRRPMSAQDFEMWCNEDDDEDRVMDGGISSLKQRMSSLRLPCNRRQSWECQFEFKHDPFIWPGSIANLGIAGIGVRQFAAAYRRSHRIIIYSIEGKVEGTLNVEQAPRAIAFARLSNRMIVVYKDRVKVFNQDGSLAFKFFTISSDEAGKTNVNLCSTGVKDNGNILVGDFQRLVLTEHGQAGEVLRTISVSTRPWYLAILDERRVVLSDRLNVVVVDCETGAQLASIKKHDYRKIVSDVCCWNCHIFVAIDNGHIYWYDAEGQFQGCIDQGLTEPPSITFMTDGQFLVAADRYHLAVYKNPLIEDKRGETALTMQSTADEDKDEDNIGGKPKTDLQFWLDEFNKQTANLSENDQWETRLQLPNIDLGYFDHKGGNLDPKEHGVHLTIPQGALPQGQDPQKVYIYIDFTPPPLDKMKPSAVPLAPVVHCGPQGLKFEKSIILSFPHSASRKDVQINPLMRHSLEDQWEEFDGKAMLVTDDRVIFLVDHFGLFTVSGTPSDGSTKWLTLAAFGPLNPTSGRYRIRVHGWNYGDGATEMKVKKKEEEMDCRMLDDCRDLSFFWNQGDVVIEVTDLIEGWTTCTQSWQNIAHQKIRKYPSNSVTFDLTQQQQAAASSASDPEVYCNVLSYQKSADERKHACSWNNVRFAIRPQLNEPKERPNGENQASSSRPTCIADQMNLGCFRKQHGETRPEEFGGFPEIVIMDLCDHLDADDADERPRWKRLADDLGVWGRLTKDFGAYDLLAIYFEVRRASGKDSEQSVISLVADLRKVYYHRAVEIIEEWMGNRVPDI